MNTDNDYEKLLNPKITEGNTTTNDLFHDLTDYLNELFQEIPDEKEKEMILRNISNYYDSLNALLVKHTIDHPRKSKYENQQKWIKL